MTRLELIRCYRRRAKETHPDRGGKREIFVQVQEAYECLMKRKS
jgi:curved DNA-binding protein CbpA